VVLGFPDEQADQGQDEERGNADNDPFHGGANSRRRLGLSSSGDEDPDRWEGSPTGRG
jgi:hypothetical protein